MDPPPDAAAGCADADPAGSAVADGGASPAPDHREQQLAGTSAAGPDSTRDGGAAAALGAVTGHICATERAPIVGAAAVVEAGAAVTADARASRKSPSVAVAAAQPRAPARGAPVLAAAASADPEPLAVELAHDFFLSHYQATGGDQVMTLELKLSNMGFECWLDQNAKSITKEAMAAGVRGSRVFLLFLSEGVLGRPFTLFEIKTAMRLGKPITLMHETDARHGAFDFAEAEGAPPSVAELTLTHESLPWRRRRFEQDAILAELIKSSGLAPSRAAASAGSSGGRAGAGAAAAVTAAGGAGALAPALAPIPITAPVLPDTVSPRSNDQARVLDVLLDRAADASGKPKVLAHGMAGLGKTTLSGTVVRLHQVRAHFDRITFVSAGQEPAMLEIQKTMHHQLLGTPMEEKSGATVASQREVLQSMSSGQTWLVTLDDIWTAEHERLLNFVDPAAAPECKVFVTTRFAKLLPGYVEVALGLLDEAEAVELLLGTAELELAAATAEQAAAAKTICKQAGYLPLYIGLMGRLIYEVRDADVAWEVEVLAMLEEDRAGLLGAESQGAMIVGGSLSQIKDDDTRELFVAFAVAPEDVPMPMPVVELIWCSKRQIKPPLKRLALMRLRKHVFTLLDRNLVLGESTAGVYMHDVVREHSQEVAGVEPLRQHQRALVRLLLAATPAQDWPSQRGERLGGYVLQALRWHFRGALLDDRSSDAEALGWLSNGDPYVVHSFVLRELINAIGAAALEALAKTAAAEGNAERAGFYGGCRAIVDGTVHMGQGIGPTTLTGYHEPVAADHPALWAAEQLAAVPDGGTPWTRSFELGLRSVFAPKWGTPLWGANQARVAAVLGHSGGVVEPQSLAARMMLAAAYTKEGALCCALGQPSAAGAQVVEEMNRAYVASTARCARAAMKVGSHFEERDPAKLPAMVATFMHLLSNSGCCFTFPSLLDPGDIFSTDHLKYYFTEHDFPRDHAAIQACNSLGYDCSLEANPINFVLVRHGLISLGRDREVQERKWIHQLDPFNFQFQAHAWVGRQTSVARVAGLQAVTRDGFNELAFPVDGDGILASFELFLPVLKNGGYGPIPSPLDGVEGLFSSCGIADGSVPHMAYFARAFQEKAFVFGADGYTADLVEGVLDDIPPGWSCSDKVGVVEAANGTAYNTYTGSMEPEAREALGQHNEAIAAATLITQQFPYNKALSLLCRLVVARCQSALAGTTVSDTSRATFSAAIEDGLQHNAPLLSLGLARDLIVVEVAKDGAAATGAGRGEAMGALRRAVAAMPLASVDLTELLRRDGLDGGPAEPAGQGGGRG